MLEGQNSRLASYTMQEWQQSTKKETTKASNYRPISLLSGCYNSYMLMIEKGIQTEVEDAVSAMQYGFRSAKSTSNASFLIRRKQEYAESTGSELFSINTYIGERPWIRSTTNASAMPWKDLEYI